MSVDFTSVRNHNERAVCDAVLASAERYPGLSHDTELLADVACVALNRLQPRYIRHEVDFAFYLSEKERGESEHGGRATHGAISLGVVIGTAPIIVRLGAGKQPGGQSRPARRRAISAATRASNIWMAMVFRPPSGTMMSA